MIIGALASNLAPNNKGMINTPVSEEMQPMVMPAAKRKKMCFFRKNSLNKKV
jgi:hypothetical protein